MPGMDTATADNSPYNAYSDSTVHADNGLLVECGYDSIVVRRAA